MQDLFQSNKRYTVESYESHDKWLEKRGHGIGGSDAPAMVGMNPYKTLRELWNEKKYGSKPFTNEFIQYGIIAEPGLRILYQAKHPNSIIFYKEDTVLISNDYEWMRYSPDGLIIDENGRKGILEIKTAMIQNSSSYHKWDDGVPDNYYIQTLHGLLVTGFDFVNYIAELRFQDGSAKIIERRYTRQEAEEDLYWLIQKENEVWNEYFVKDVEPPIVLKL